VKRCAGSSNDSFGTAARLYLTQTNEKIKTENSISENKSQESQVMSKQ
jgi:hypothetical protein